MVITSVVKLNGWIKRKPKNKDIASAPLSLHSGTLEGESNAWKYLGRYAYNSEKLSKLLSEVRDTRFNS